MTLPFILLLVGAYFLGAIPLSYLLARRRGIDLTRYGTGQVGAGNFWRMTRSWKLGVVVVLWDLGKGILAMTAARALGASVGLQLIAGLAVIIGHNWPVFLHFRGGRGIGTAIGIMIALPFLGDTTPWITIVFVVIAGLGSLILRSTPLPLLVGLIAAPVTSAALRLPADTTLALAAITLVTIAGRLAVTRTSRKFSTRAIMLNRLLFDRDTRDRKGWMYRKPEANGPERDRKR